jgi:MYXO-CTERM domain-containing protein
VTVKDYPSWDERDVHIWTNMVRVDPAEFFGPGNSWGANCDLDDFQDSEKTPMRPLYHDVNLNDAGRFHSIDMWENNWFDHASSDGTSFPARLGRFYPESGMIGENIASGYPDALAAVLYGWMCSPGHRANIMNPDYNELGVGVVGTYYTQDFAAGVLETDSPIAMGNHSPEVPTSPVDFLVDFFVDYQGGKPDTLEVVLDGNASPVLLTFGAPDQGVYTTTLFVGPNTNCHSYYFQWSEGDASGTFPENGSYLFGSGCTEDAMWEARDSAEAEGFYDGEDEIIGCGCSASAMGAGPATGMFGLLGVLLLMRRRP